MKTIAILGGGFSGTVTAINLARLSQAPLRICLINHGYPLGRGIAYGTRHPEHLLNVAARNMSAFPDQPAHFVDWLTTRWEYRDVPTATLREQFAPRRVYGDYLQSLLFWYRPPTPDESRTRIDCIDAEAIDVAIQGRHAIVLLSEGAPIEADKVVLATGNQAPAELKFPGGDLDHPFYCRNPWLGWEERLPDPSADVILLGTGLTMIDAILTLRRRGWRGKLWAISRNGLLPWPHFKGIEYPDFPPQDPTHLGLTALVDLIEEHCAKLRARGENPAIVVDKLRPFTQRIWQNLTLAEKREFSNRHRSRWGVLRHRIPREIHDQLEDSKKTGQLQVVAAKFRSLTADGDRLRLTIETADGERTLEAGLVLNCTGPRESYKTAPDAIFRNLFASGLIDADDLDMGLRVAPDFTILDRNGRRSPHLLALGPLLRGTLWETTAVPELRVQALRVAETILDELRQGQRDAITVLEAEVLEYCI